MEIVGFFEQDSSRASKFSQDYSLTSFGTAQEAASAADAVIVCSETAAHLELIRIAAQAGRPVLCEKPLLAFPEEATELRELVASAGLRLMTAFPCPYSPAWARVIQRVNAGEIGQIVAISATNHGRNPGGWFVDPAKSGGGALMDHVVHVADLLGRLLETQPSKVTTAWQGEPIDVNGMVTLDYASGQFVTLDSSWSRTPSYRTWGDVTMQIVGDAGVIELDLFNQSIGVYGSSSPSHRLSGFGSSLDALMLADFVQWVEGGKEPLASLEDGLAACEVAWAAMRSKASGGLPALVAAS